MTPEEMKSLAPGDTVHFRCGGKAVVEKLRFEGIILLTFSESKFEAPYFYDGKYFSSTGPFDIIAIEKAVQIPEGFTPWHGGECPLSATIKFYLIYRDGTKSAVHTHPETFAWGHDGSKNDIIAYRIITPPKQSGELWVVISAKGIASVCKDKQQAITLAKSYSSKPLNIFPITGSKWTEGDGLELLEE